jgi:hypothetical protein
LSPHSSARRNNEADGDRAAQQRPPAPLAAAAVAKAARALGWAHAPRGASPPRVVSPRRATHIGAAISDSDLLKGMLSQQSDWLSPGWTPPADMSRAVGTQAAVGLSVGAQEATGQVTRATRSLTVGEQGKQQVARSQPRDMASLLTAAGVRSAEMFGQVCVLAAQSVCLCWGKLQLPVFREGTGHVRRPCCGHFARAAMEAGSVRMSQYCAHAVYE